ncbi:MAG: prolyl oligopeptidase family serine peptidase [Acidobacteria bacterium]|nr:prolyl oligopeptidase family serine peptidase [Acidobacteriota bacterium]
MFRTRVNKDILVEFLPPARRSRRERVVVLCDGMPSIPRKQPLAEFLSGKGYWVFYPRYRGAWESGGEFLARSPHEDILEVVEALDREFVESAFGKRFRVRAQQVFVIGGSFGGAAAILCALDPRVSKVIANCPVVDWSVLPRAEKVETSNPNYAGYIREAFGNAYRLSDRNWKKLHEGKFYNPAARVGEIDPAKIMMFHAQDDPSVPYSSVKKFAERTGVKLKSLRRGGHVSTDYIVRKYWPDIRDFFRQR